MIQKKDTLYIKELVLALILVFTAILIVAKWFSGRKPLVVGEEMFFILDPAKAFKISISPWLYLTEPGLPTTRFYLPRITFLFPISILFQLGVENYLLQGLSFLVLVILGMFGVLFLVRSLFPQKSSFVFLLSLSVFYFLNLYSQSQVFGRFILNGFFVWALLPWTLFFYNEYQKTGDLKFILLFIIVSTFLSHAFGNVGFLFTIWLPVFTVAVARIILSIKKRSHQTKKILYRLFIFLTTWFISNFWWLYPYLKIGPSLFWGISDPKGNFGELRGLSVYFPTREIVLLRQAFLFGEKSPLYYWYSNDVVYFISISILFVAVIGWLVSRKEKNQYILLALAFVGWFIGKGTNPPFGYWFYKNLFFTFPFTAGLRNSYEKFGVVWLIPYSIFFGFGIEWIYKKIKHPINKLIIGVFLFFSLGLLVWPTWTGALFNGSARSIEVKLPGFYEQANTFLGRRGGSIYHMPQLPGDGLRTTWGFQGLEGSEYIFDRPSISKILRSPLFDRIYFLLKENQKNKNFSRLLGALGVSDIILHKDIQETISGTISYARAKEIIESLSGVKYIAQFGELSIYKIDEQLVAPPVYLIDTLIFVNDIEDGFEKILTKKVDFQRKEGFVIGKDLTEELRGKLIDLRKSGRFEYRIEEQNPRKYKVYIKDSEGKFILFLNEIFSPNWEARIENRKIAEHFVVNGYANGWVVDRKGSYTIDVVFKIWPWE